MKIEPRNYYSIKLKCHQHAYVILTKPCFGITALCSIMKKRITRVTLFAIDYISKYITTRESRHNNVHFLLRTSSVRTVTEKSRLDFRQGQENFLSSTTLSQALGPTKLPNQSVTTASRCSECVEVYLHSPIRRHGVVLKSTTDNFSFMSSELSFAALEDGEMNGKHSRSSRS